VPRSDVPQVQKDVDLLTISADSLRSTVTYVTFFHSQLLTVFGSQVVTVAMDLAILNRHMIVTIDGHSNAIVLFSVAFFDVFATGKNGSAKINDNVVRGDLKNAISVGVCDHVPARFDPY
jgi:hypothetical protein